MSIEIEYEDDDPIDNFDEELEYSVANPQQLFYVTYVKIDLSQPNGKVRSGQFCNNVYESGLLIEQLYSDGAKAIQIFKLSTYSEEKALKVLDKKRKRKSK